MAVVKVLTRDWDIDINGTAIGGTTEMTFTRSKKDAETTTKDEAGWDSHLVSRRQTVITLKGKYLEDPVNGDRDPGQAAVEVLGLTIGQSSLGTFHLESPGGTLYTFSASVEIGDVGGAEEEASDWNAKLTVSGPVTKTP